MNVKNLIGTVLDTAIKIILIVVVVTYTYRYAMQAYEFGYRVFAEKPVSTEEGAKAISISVAEDATVGEIGTVLEEKGMIRDARLFYIQELLSGYHGKINPGIYELRSDMTVREMLAVMSAETAETEESSSSGEADSSGNAEQEASGETETPENESEEAEDTGTESEDGDSEAEGGEAEAE